MQHLMETYDGGFKPHVILVEEDGWMHDGERLTPAHAPTIIHQAIVHEARYALLRKTHAADILVELSTALTLAEMDVR